MPKNVYPDLTVAELLPIRDRLREARNGGTITSVGIEPRISNQFADVPTCELNKRLEEVEWSLYLAAQGTDQSAIYLNPYSQKVLRVKTVHAPGLGFVGSWFGRWS
jgi:hypothetical protein